MNCKHPIHFVGSIGLEDTETVFRILSETAGGTVSLTDGLSQNIPPTVKLGIYLCYGGPGHKHIVEPRDLGTSVEFANTLCSGVRWPIDYIHMAVPRATQDSRRRLGLAPGEKVESGFSHNRRGHQRISSIGRFR